MNANHFPRSSRDRRYAQAISELSGGVHRCCFAGVTLCAPRAPEGPVALCCDRDREYAGREEITCFFPGPSRQKRTGRVSRRRNQTISTAGTESFASGTVILVQHVHQARFAPPSPPPDAVHAISRPIKRTSSDFGGTAGAGDHCRRRLNLFGRYHPAPSISPRDWRMNQ